MSGEIPDTVELWRQEVLVLLRGILAGVERLVEEEELSAPIEPAAASRELPEGNEPLPTWILTDAAVARLEAAIEQESRVRGSAYGG